jgi:hypothetical protein
MKMLSCSGVRRRLSAFHDGELPVEEQVAVGSHLRGCAGCASEVAAIRGVGDVLRTGSMLYAAQTAGALTRFPADVMNRRAVEQEESVPAQVSRAFEDMRLGFAALGSAVATVVTVLIMIGILHFGPRSERPDSLAVMIDTFGPTAGVDNNIRPPSVAGASTLSDPMTSEEDAVFALAATVTRNGRIANLEYLSDRSSGPGREEVERLLDELSQRRFEPARMGASPVTVKTVFLLARTTVRAKLPITPKQSWMTTRLLQPLAG